MKPCFGNVRPCYLAQAAILVLCSSAVLHAEELGTGLTYQGRLMSEGTAFTGTADLMFELWDAATVGTQIGVSANVPGVTVTDGLFTVEINSANEFGPNAFAGDARWLRVLVRDAGVGGGYAALEPRQKLTAVPHALYSKDAPFVGGDMVWLPNAAGVHYLDGNVGIGTTNPVGKLDVAGSIRAVRNNDPDQFIQISSASSTGHWVIARTRESNKKTLTIQSTHDGSGSPSGESQMRFRVGAHSAPTEAMRIRESGRIGIGTTSPQSLLHVGQGDGVSIALGQNPKLVLMKDVANDKFKIQIAGSGFGGKVLQLGRDDGNNNITVPGKLGIGTDTPQGLVHVSGSGSALGQHVAVFENTDTNAGDGIAIKINQAHTNRDNNFVTFLNGNNVVTGRIEGYDLQHGDWVSPPPIPTFNLNIDTGVVLHDPSIWFNPGIAECTLGVLPTFTWESCDVFGIPVPCSFSWDGGAFPDCDFSIPWITGPPITVGEPSIDFTPPTPEQVEALLCWAFEHNLDSLVTLDPLEQYTQSLRLAAAPLCLDEGVIYGSKGADYAEYLEKLYPQETLRSGYVVGVFGGKITRYTEGAEQVMVVSTAPVVVGNIPADDDLDLHEKVAFMGQVPVVTRGTVRIGDYLVPSGRHDGTAVAVAADDITLDHVAHVIGRAWSATDDEVGFVNVLVGARDEAAAHVMRRQKTQLDRQAARITALEVQMESVASLIADHSGLAISK